MSDKATAHTFEDISQAPASLVYKALWTNKRAQRALERSPETEDF